jgi:ATP-dependent DNA ligase
MTADEPPLPEPMLARAVDRLPPPGTLPGGLVFEPKWDGWRLLVSTLGDRVRLRSRAGTDLTAAFPEIVQAAAELDEELVLDGEVVIYRGGRLDFGALGHRLGRRLGETARLARTEPAYFIAFDLLHRAGRSLLGRPYRVRRAELEELFAEHVLTAPWSLSPSTSDRRQAKEWMTAWSAVGVEGVVAKGLSQRYEPGRRGWLKVRARRSAEAVVGAVTGSPARPETVLLGRYDKGGRLRLVARSTPLAPRLRQELGQVLTSATPAHPWRGMRIAKTWGSREPLVFAAVEPAVVVEFTGDTAVDTGRWRHAVRVLRLRPDVAPQDVPGFGAGYEAASG